MEAWLYVNQNLHGKKTAKKWVKIKKRVASVVISR